MYKKGMSDFLDIKMMFCANTDWSLYNFRRAQIESVLKQEWKVGCVCSDGPFVKDIKELGMYVVK